MRAIAVVLAVMAGLGQQLISEVPPLLEGRSTVFCCSELPYVTSNMLTKKELVNQTFPQKVAAELGFESYKELDVAFKKGKLVDVPNNPNFGFIIRTTGRYAIAEKETNPKNKLKLMRLRPEALGLLYLVATKFQEEISDNYRPLELTSLVRTWVYQKSLIPGNPNADVKKQGIAPTHIFAVAFDIGRVSLTPKQDRILHAILIGLEEQGICIYYKEGKAQAAYHVIAIPSAWPTLKAVYEQHQLQLLARTN